MSRSKALPLMSFCAKAGSPLSLRSSSEPLKPTMRSAGLTPTLILPPKSFWWKAYWICIFFVLKAPMASLRNAAPTPCLGPTKNRGMSALMTIVCGAPSKPTICILYAPWTLSLLSSPAAAGL